MKQLWEQLRPGERRWVIAIGCLVFVVLNYFFVWPQFKQWRINSENMAKAAETVRKYQPEIAKEATYKKALGVYDSEGGGGIPAADQILNFVTFYQSRAVENGIQIQSESSRPPHTNEFSVDQQATLDVVGGEKNLVGFLYSLGSSASQMRVREMNLHAVEPNRYQLHASLTIVASYQKKPGGPAPAKGPAAPKSAPASPAYVPAPYLTSNTVYPLNRSNKPPGMTAKTNATSITNKPGQPKHP